ncbi:MAG: hypothetical protein DSM107014_08600 [Gomphosphaeria aponina SAG 52.96 = DSM 107014]|uniref:Uncharacterized protein n=1 Tax=Gomphosphaeria aponina SAG 52.96 = DSM 107014 TaxID=1521640 RepID=A0A941GQD5_9CHRO|nr:hypothetical protein [Gomphosphaeria aponina SAG 52.96 = DSM 107014]
MRKKWEDHEIRFLIDNYKQFIVNSSWLIVHATINYQPSTINHHYYSEGSTTS